MTAEPAEDGHTSKNRNSKHEIRISKQILMTKNRNSKQIRMTKNRNSKPYDLEDRTLAYAKRVRTFVKKLPKTIANIEDIKQLVRASGSVGANYIEANESLSKK